jgi:hypothetical protein
MQSQQGMATGPGRRPANFVAGVIDERGEFERAVEDVVAAGVARESIGVLQGEEGAEGIAHRYGGGFVGRLRRGAELFGDEAEFVQHYEREARAGHFVMGVPLPDATHATRERFHGILAAHGAHSVVSGGPWTHTVAD